jgi:hypothetical protein
MRITEVIKKLKAIQKDYGDIECVSESHEGYVDLRDGAEVTMFCVEEVSVTFSSSNNDYAAIIS